MASQLLKHLITKGLFPREVPEIFSGAKFGSKLPQLVAADFGGTNTWTKADSFTIPHSRLGRRMAAIVNPAPYFAMARLICNNWNEIQKLYRVSSISFSRPKVSRGSRAITATDFSGFRDALVTRASGYSFVLRSDFARFFPTLYTHALEWAVHTKSASKANLKTKRASKVLHWGAEIDKCVQRMQEGQTQGLPIGPDTSYILAELVASAIDRDLKGLLRKPLVGARLIDDYALFFESRGEAEAAHSALTHVAANLQVAINTEKTYIDEITGPVREFWTYGLQEFNFPATQGAQRRALIRYTDAAAVQYAAIKDPAVAVYAAKVISRKLVHPANIDVAIACLLRIANIAPGAMPTIARFIIGYHAIGYVFEIKPISIFITSLLGRSLDLGFDHEASWCLWVAIQLEIRIPKSTIAKVSLSRSSVVILLARQAQEAKLCGAVVQNVLGKKLVASDFTEGNWLLAYEGAMKDWFGWSKGDVKGTELEALAVNGVYFMNPKAGLASGVRMRKSRKVLGSSDLQQLDFKDLEDQFEIQEDFDIYGSVADKLLLDEDEDF
jgi:hypothetical protein